MKNFRKLVLGVLAGFAAFSCADENALPIITFDSATKGAYVRLVEESDRSVNLFDISNSTYTYTVEFVDVEKGSLVSQYILDLSFEDNDDSNGDESNSIENYSTYEASSFTTSADGFQGLENLSYSASDLISALGVTEANISPGDNFVFTGRLVMQDGSVHNADNSSSAVNGAAFRGHMTYALVATCPSAIAEGTYNAVSGGTSTDGCPPTNPLAGLNYDVTITALGGGIYEVSDFSAGVYQDWYGACYGYTFETSANISDVCNVLSFSLTEAFGCGVTATGSYDPGTGVLTYTWDNCFGDFGDVTLTPQ